MRVLLIWPRFKKGLKGTVPLGLLKIAGAHRDLGDEVLLVRAVHPKLHRPDRVYVSSLFTYDRDPVIRAVHSVWSNWDGEVEVQVGGIWASLLPEQVKYLAGVEPHVGLLPWVEEARPAWDLWPGDLSVTFASRGCIRRCPWCAAWRHDGEGFRPRPVEAVLRSLDPDRPKVELWDNNILVHPQFGDLMDALGDKKVKIPQGIDARLVTKEVVKILRRSCRDIYLSYDQAGQREAVERTVRWLREAGHGRGHVLVFMLYGWYDRLTGRGDTPAEVYQRIDQVIEWGGSVYPMRFRPVDSADKGFISPLWGWEELRKFNQARGDLSCGGGVVHRSLAGYIERRGEVGGDV